VNKPFSMPNKYAAHPILLSGRQQMLSKRGGFIPAKPLIISERFATVPLFQRYRSFAQQISAVLFLSDETSDSDRRFAYRSYPFVTGTRTCRSLSHPPSFSLPFYSLFRHATSVELFFRKGNRLSQSRQCRLPSRVIRKNLPLRSRAYFSVPALSDCSRHLSGAEK